MGAYGSVYKCRLEAEGMELAVKLMTLPKLVGDRCVLHDIFTEISVLDDYKADPRVSHLYDYGVDETYFWIIMKFYKCSLRSWRMRQTKPLSENLGLYLDVYMQVLQCSMFLVDNSTSSFELCGPRSVLVLSSRW